MPDALPPPVTDEDVVEPGWYTDPESPDLLRWWDGEEWSDTDFKVPGDDGYPWWYGDSLRERFGPFTRAGSVFNAGLGGFLVGSYLWAGDRDVVSIVLALGLEAVVVGIAIWVWWRGPIPLEEIAAWVRGRN
jgi:hypothetical protein